VIDVVVSGQFLMNATGQIPIAADMRTSDDPISPDRIKLSVTRAGVPAWRARA
jgi:hypothetical protein